MSLARASASPPPDAAPLTAAMTDRAHRAHPGHQVGDRLLGGQPGLGRPRPRAGSGVAPCLRSSPAQKPAPAPVSTTTRHAGRACSAANVSCSPAISSASHGVAGLGPVERHHRHAVVGPVHLDHGHGNRTLANRADPRVWGMGAPSRDDVLAAVLPKASRPSSRSRPATPTTSGPGPRRATSGTPPRWPATCCACRAGTRPGSTGPRPATPPSRSTHRSSPSRTGWPWPSSTPRARSTVRPGSPPTPSRPSTISGASPTPGICLSATPGARSPPACTPAWSPSSGTCTPGTWLRPWDSTIDPPTPTCWCRPRPPPRPPFRSIVGAAGVWPRRWADRWRRGGPDARAIPGSSCWAWPVASTRDGDKPAI